MSDNEVTNAGDATGPSGSDGLAIALRGVLGAVPLVGPLVGEIITCVIPNQRLDRVTRLLHALERRVCDLEESTVHERLKSPEGIDLLEDAFLLASRALTDERIGYIADVLCHGICEDQSKLSDKKFLMWLLGQLDDAEVILLTWLNMLPNADESFTNRHWHIVQPRAPHRESTQEELDDATLQESRKTHLRNLGLIRPRFRRTIKQQIPEFDDRTGMMKASGHDVTPLGRLLLRTIDVQDAVVS